MYNSILVPIALDHTGRSGPAIKAAKTLIEPGGTVTLLHVIEHIPAYASNYIPESVFEQNRKEAETRLHQMAKEIGEQTRIAVVEGTSSHTILEMAEDDDVDCIVIASHRPGLQDYFLGSTAARVVRHAKCNVHILR